VGDFKFLTPDEISQLDLLNIDEDSPTGYVIDCDLHYPTELHDKYADYPLALEHLTVSEEMLSPFAKSLRNQGWRWTPTKKLIPNLHDKTHYVTHYRNLQSILSKVSSSPKFMVSFPSLKANGSSRG